MRTIAASEDVRVEALRGGRAMLVGLISVAAAAGIMLLAVGLGDLVASGAVLGILFVATVLINPIVGIVTLLGTLLVGLPGFLVGAAAGRLTANNLIGMLLLLALIAQLSVRRDLWFLRTPQVIVLFLIGAAFMASLVHSWYTYIPAQPLPKNVTENTLFLFFSRLGFLIIFVNFIRTQRHALVILLSVLAFTMLVIPSAFYNLATWSGERDVMTGKVAEFRIVADVSSWGRNENRLAFVCNITMLLIWAFAQIQRRKVIWAVVIPMMMALATLVVSTGSRSGFVSLGLVALFLLFQRGLGWSLRVGAAVAVAAALVFFFAFLPEKTFERLTNYSLDQSERQEAWRSTTSRIETNEHALEMLWTAPLLGVGPGNFMWLHRERYPYSIAAGRPNHNSYLWAATEGGSVVIALYLVLFFFIWRDLLKAQERYSPGHPLWHVTRFLKGYLMIFLFFSGFADFWLEPHLYLLAGLSILVKRLAPEEGGPPPVSTTAITHQATR